MIVVRQSTTRTVMVGPVLDADGVAVTDAVVADFEISKNGGDPAALNGSATLTHRNTGHYSLALTASDLDTVGQAEIVINDAANACQIKVLTVVEEAVYDMLFAASALGYIANAPVNVAQFGGSNGTFSSGRPEVNTTHIGGTAQTARDVGGAVPAAAAGASGGLLISGSNSGTTTFAALTVTGATTFTGATTWTGALTASNASNNFRVNGVAPGASGGLFIAGTNAATAVTTSFTTTFTGNLTGSVGSVTGAVGSVTGAVGSVTGNVGGTVNGLTATAQGHVRTATGLASANLDTQLSTIDSEIGTIDGIVDTLTTEMAKVPKSDSTVTWNATALASINTQMDTALTDIHLDHLLAATYDPASKPGAADALLNELVGNDGGLAQFTANALELAPSGGGGLTVQEIVDGVWDEPMASHVDSGSTGEALAAAGGAGDPWITALPGAYSAGQAGYIVGTNLNATVSSRATQTSVDTIDDLLDTEVPALTSELAKVPKSDGTATWNSTALASLQQEATDALNAYDPPTRAEMTSDTNSVLTAVGDVPTNAEFAARTLAAADYATATAVADLPTNAELATALDPLPTAAENATALLGSTVEGTTTVVQSIRLANSALGGKASGLETTEASYRDLADTKDRIVATVDEDGNRTAVTRDLT